MKNMYLGFLYLVICTGNALAQGESDPKAKTILDDLSKTTKAYKTIVAEFTYQSENKTKKINETQKGTIKIKGNKYRLSIKGQEVICDGKTIWTYIKDANEVQITEIDPNDTESLNPSNIFTIYEKGFKYKYEKEEQGQHVIHLYPTDPGKRKFHTAKLRIDKIKKQTTNLTMMMKDGGTDTYIINSFKPNTELADNIFTFSKEQFPGAEVVDLR